MYALKCVFQFLTQNLYFGIWRRMPCRDCTQILIYIEYVEINFNQKREHSIT